ncbi:MAG: hypothetical protein DSY53_00240 [Persephonella sp.]|nr:MAG: hypothetical protein DSY53_00240 [Persephonella sp.]
MKKIIKIIILSLITLSTSYSKDFPNDICNFLSNVYNSCKKDLKYKNLTKRALYCNNLSIDTVIYFNSLFQKNPLKAKNIGKIAGEICFEACMGEGNSFKTIKKILCE